MALATTCPRCQTGFRVVPDQLKIRRGLVRCGACRHVFSGLDSLRYVNEQTDLALATPPEAPALAGSLAPLAPTALTAPVAPLAPIDPTAPVAPTARAVPIDPVASAPPSRPTDPTAPDEAPDALQARSATDTISAPPSPPPGAALSAERLAASYGRGEPDIADEFFDEAESAAPAVASHHAHEQHESAVDDAQADHRAPAYRAPAVDLNRPTDLVVLEGLEELDDLDTLDLPDYLSEPALPAEPPAGLASTSEATDTLSLERPPSAGPVAEDDAPASIIGKHALEPAPAAGADDAAPTRSLEGLPEPAGGMARETGAADPETANNALPSTPLARDPGDAPEAWSAALLAPDPAARRARAGDAGGPEAVDFFATAARAGGFASRRTLFSAVLCVVLSVTLALQLTLAGRDWLASRVPALEPALVALSGLIGLRVQAPRELDSLTLESFDVQAGASADALMMDLLMRNRAAHAVRWPAIEMSLSDAAGVLLVRKVVLPADYLGPSLPPAGAPPDQETALRLALQVTGFAPAGFSLKLFYP